MSIKAIIAAGDEGKSIKEIVEALNSFNNVTGPQYDALLEKARAATGDPDLLLKDIKDDDINQKLYGGRATASDIAETKTTLVAIEAVLLIVRSHVDKLPSVDA